MHGYCLPKGSTDIFKMNKWISIDLWIKSLYSKGVCSCAGVLIFYNCHGRYKQTPA